MIYPEIFKAHGLLWDSEDQESISEHQLPIADEADGMTPALEARIAKTRSSEVPMIVAETRLVSPARLTFPVQTAPGSVGTAGEMKKAIDARQEAFGRWDHHEG